MAAYLGGQRFVRCEGIPAICKLPKHASATLRHLETAALTAAFTPLPPLPASAPVPAQQFIHIAITDWSLFVLKPSSSQDEAPGVLLELPWLAVQRMVWG
jgi:hypothetical protein